MHLVHKIADLILYSSVFVALCAVALVTLSGKLIGVDPEITIYTRFTFFSVIMLYSIHRIMGIKKVEAFEHEGRFAVIKKYRYHILVYGIAGLAGALYYFLRFDLQLQKLVILPAGLSLLYVIPFLPGHNRLRDVHLVKIFTIAVTWAWVTAFIPLHIAFDEFRWPIVFAFLERALFVFAITIPFDIRDLEVDAHTGVRTLPILLGTKKSKILAIGCLALHLIIVLSLSWMGFYTGHIIIPYLLFFLVTAVLINKSAHGLSDYYYSGLLDGTMILQWLLVSAYLYLFS